MSPRLFRRGNTVLETAMVLPILLLLGFGTIEFGHYFYVKQSLQGAAREGARVAILGTSSNADVAAAVNRAMAMSGLESSGYSVITTPASIDGTATGTVVTVAVECNWGAVGVRPMQLMSASKPVRAAAAMRRE